MIWLNLLNYAIKWEYSYKQWKVIVMRMILKATGDNKIQGQNINHEHQK